jgi:type VI secretion system protein VasD
MRPIRPFLIIVFTGLLAATLISGCSSKKGVIDKVFGDSPPKTVIHISASPDLNPDIQGRPSPIVLRIYTLYADDIFRNADFFALYENDTAILGDDMAARDEYEISPGKTLKLDERELPMQARYIGVMAAYRDLDNAVWRGTIETPVDEVTYVNISLGKLTLTVSKGEKKGWF